MGMTMAEKILTRASGLKETYAGDYVTAKIDLAMAHEGAAWTLPYFRDLGVERVWNPERIVVLLDHYTPPPTVKAAELHKTVREFVKEQLRVHVLSIPAFFMDIYVKLIDLDLSRVNSILKFRYSNWGTPARAPDDMLRSLLAMGSLRGNFY